MITDDPKDPRLTHGPDSPENGPQPQSEVYLALPEAERAKGYVRPLRSAYLHTACGAETRMKHALAETYACRPDFYGATYCVACGLHRPVSEFTWAADGTVVGS